MEARRDVVVYLLVLMGAVILYRDVGRLPELATYQRIGPGFWPRLCLIGTAVLALGGLLRAAWTWRQPAGPALPLLGRAPGQLLGAVGLTLVYPFAMDVTGFLVATLLFQLALLPLLGIRRPAAILGASALNLALLYGVFARALRMPLPRGTGVFRALSLWFY